MYLALRQRADTGFAHKDSTMLFHWAEAMLFGWVTVQSYNKGQYPCCHPGGDTSTGNYNYNTFSLYNFSHIIMCKGLDTPTTSRTSTHHHWIKPCLICYSHHIYLRVAALMHSTVKDGSIQILLGQYWHIDKKIFSDMHVITSLNVNITCHCFHFIPYETMANSLIFFISGVCARVWVVSFPVLTVHHDYDKWWYLCFPENTRSWHLSSPSSPAPSVSSSWTTSCCLRPPPSHSRYIHLYGQQLTMVMEGYLSVYIHKTIHPLCTVCICERLFHQNLEVFDQRALCNRKFSLSKLFIYLCDTRRTI